jgi:putative peptide maturation dehydrogenase
VTRYRRSRFVFFRCGVDGEASPSIAVSALSGEEATLGPVAQAALLATPTDEWVEAGDDGLRRRLAEIGLLVSDDPGARFAELRRREDHLAENGWYRYAALYHGVTRRSGVDLAHAEELDDARREHVANSRRKRQQRAGGASPPFHHAPNATAVRELALIEPDGGVFEALRRRRTARGYDPDAEISADQLSVLLRTVFGCTGLADRGDGYVLQKKTSPSGGALHPIEAYPIVRRVEGLAPGLYHYDVERHALELLEELDDDEATEYLRVSTCGQGPFKHAQVAFVLTVRFRRNFWKYWRQQDQYGVLLLDAGHLSQTLYLVAAELGLDAFVTAIVNHDDIGRRLALDRFDEGVLAICGCGIADGLSALMPQFTDFTPSRLAVNQPAT